MPIKLVCGQCGRTVELPAEREGQTVHCSCGEELVVEAGALTLPLSRRERAGVRDDAAQASVNEHAAAPGASAALYGTRGILFSILLALVLGWLQAQGSSFHLLVVWPHQPHIPWWWWLAFPALGIAVLRLVSPKGCWGWRAMLLGFVTGAALGRLMLGVVLEVLVKLPRRLFLPVPDIEWRHVWTFMATGTAFAAAWTATRAQRKAAVLDKLIAWLRFSAWERLEVVEGIEERQATEPLLWALRGGFAFAIGCAFWLLPLLAMATGETWGAHLGLHVSASFLSGAVGGGLLGVGRGCRGMLSAAVGFGLGFLVPGIVFPYATGSADLPERVTATAIGALSSGLAFALAGAAGAGLARLGLGVVIAAAAAFGAAGIIGVCALWFLEGLPFHSQVFLALLTTYSLAGVLLGAVLGVAKTKAPEADQ